MDRIALASYIQGLGYYAATRQVAEHFLVTKSVAVKALERLVADGAIERVHCADNVIRWGVK